MMNTTTVTTTARQDLERKYNNYLLRAQSIEKQERRYNRLAYEMQTRFSDVADKLEILVNVTESYADLYNVILTVFRLIEEEGVKLNGGGYSVEFTEQYPFPIRDFYYDDCKYYSDYELYKIYKSAREDISYRIHYCYCGYEELKFTAEVLSNYIKDIYAEFLEISTTNNNLFDIQFIATEIITAIRRTLKRVPLVRYEDI